MLYNVVIPLGEGPDESGHFGYVLFLVRQERLPDQRKGTAGEVPGEGHQPPLAYVLMYPAAEWLPGTTRRVVLSADPDFVWRGGDSPAAFTRGSQEYWPWQGVPLAWHLARGVSALLGVVTLLCVWGLARSLWPHNSLLALGAVALVAFNPQFLFMSGLVSNDPLLTALSALLLLACVRAVLGLRLPLNLFAPLAIGMLLGLALITKQSALLLAPVALLAVLLSSRQGAKAGGPREVVAAIAPLPLERRAFVTPRLLLHLTIFGLTTLVVAGWWYARNWHMYGDPLGLAVFKAEFGTAAFDWRSGAAWADGLMRLHRSLWGYFGWVTVPMPTFVYWIISGVEIVALIGLVRLLVANSGAERRAQRALVVASTNDEGQRQPATSNQQPAILLIVLALLLALAWTMSFALTAGVVAWQGRFLFPAIGALALLLAWGLLAWGRWMLWLAILALATLAALVPAFVIAPAYPWYTLPEQTALATRGSPVYARFGDGGNRLGVELHGWRLEPVPLQAGTSARLELTWHARSRVQTDWLVFLHLVEGEEIVWVSDQRPLDGAFPMTRFTPGDWLRDQRTLVLPPDLPPGRYVLRIGLFREDTGRRAPFYNDDDQSNVEGDSFDITTVEVVAP